jgi:hypothetical protein
MLFTSIYRKKINAAEALIPLVAFNFKTYLPFHQIKMSILNATLF